MGSSPIHRLFWMILYSSSLTYSAKERWESINRPSREKSQNALQTHSLRRDRNTDIDLSEEEILFTYKFVIAGELSDLDLSTCCKSQILEGTVKTLSNIPKLLLDDENSSHYVKFIKKRECYESPKVFVEVNFFSSLILADGNVNITKTYISNEMIKSIENGDLEESILREGLSSKQIGELTLDGGAPVHLLCGDEPPSGSPTVEESLSPSLAPMEAPLSLLFQVALAGGKTASELSECCREQVLDGARLSLSGILVGLDGRKRFLRGDEQKNRFLEDKCKQYVDRRQLYGNVQDWQETLSTTKKLTVSHFSDPKSQMNTILSAPVSAPASSERMLPQVRTKKKAKHNFRYCACDDSNNPVPPCDGDPPPRRTVKAKLDGIFITRLADNGNIVDIDFDIQIRTGEGSSDPESVLEIVDEELTEEVESGKFTENVQKQGLNVTVALGANSPSNSPSVFPTMKPSRFPSVRPSSIPSSSPTDMPTLSPFEMPSSSPFDNPSNEPSDSPTHMPSLLPSSMPSLTPSLSPSLLPSSMPSLTPSISPSSFPSNMPSLTPSISPSLFPSLTPSEFPSVQPSSRPSSTPSFIPSLSPTVAPSRLPSSLPSTTPSSSPSSRPSSTPTNLPSSFPSAMPTNSPSSFPSAMPTRTPSSSPTSTPSRSPSSSPTVTPSRSPSSHPSVSPSRHPSSMPTFVYTYLGCFKDKPEVRALPTYVGFDMKLEQCQSACDLRGYKYSGIQFWGECRCGNSGYDRYGSSDTCNCDGPNFGAWTNCVYARKSSLTPSP